MAIKATDHIVKSFDEELRRLREQILAMGGRAEAQFRDAITALAKRDSDKAMGVIESDKDIDALEMNVAGGGAGGLRSSCCIKHPVFFTTRV